MIGLSVTNKKHLLFCGSLVLLLFFLFLPGMTVLAKDDDEDENDGRFDIKATAGRAEDVEEVYVSVRNDGKDYGGYIRLSLKENSYSSEAYVYDSYVSIASGETGMVTIRFPIPAELELEQCEATLQMLDNHGKVLYSERQRRLFDASSSLQYGILSDRPDDLDYLEKTLNDPYNSYSWNNNGEKWTVVNLMPAELTDGTLLQCGILLINDYDISALSDDEIQAIESWTRKGGILIIGTGDELDSTFDAFDDDFIGAQLNQKRPNPEYSYFALNGYLDMADLKLDSAYTPFNVNYQELLEKNEGSGLIILCRMSLSDPGLDTNYLADILITEFMIARNMYVGNSANSLFSLYKLQEKYGVMQGSRTFSAMALRLIILFYVFLVGPGLYVILNKINKREKIWFVVPLVSLIFVLLVYLSSRGFSITNRQFVSIRVADASGRGEEKDYLFGYSADRREWSVTLNDKAISAGPISGGMYSHGGNHDYRYRAANTPGGTVLSYVPESTFAEAYFCMTTANSTKGGSIGGEIHLDGSKISGSLDNDTEYDFDYMLIVCNGYYDLIENVKKGSHIEVNSMGRMRYNGPDDLNSKAKKTYDHGDYEDAKLYEALHFGACSLTDDDCFVIGVCRGDELLKGNNAEESFLCVYNVW